MPTVKPAVPYGAWPSSVSAARLVEGVAAVSEIRADGDDVWWDEQRPAEGGRTQLVRRTRGRTLHDALAAWDPTPGATNHNARTAYLEYGGGAWNVRGGTVVFADWATQRLHRLDRGREPVAISPEPTVARGYRWSEPQWLDDRWLVAVRESHEPDDVARHGEAVNELVALPVDGSAVGDPTLVRVLAADADFVHSPAVHGDRVTWLRWDHPRMPWDGSEVVVATIRRGADAGPEGLDGVTVVAGGPDESVVQPGFDGDGNLLYCSDRSGWWAPYRLAAGDGGGGDSRSGGGGEPVLAEPIEGEIGGPLWVGGQRWWASLDDGRLAVVVRADGRDRLALIERDGRLTELSTPFTEIAQVVAAGDGRRILVAAGSPVADVAPCAVSVDAPRSPDEAPSLAVELLRKRSDLGIGVAEIAEPEHHEFPSADGRRAHLLYYPPTNPAVRPVPGEAPPLLVMIHGGPTAAVRNRLDLAKQFWTSRGFAVADVDYCGSVGYGRPYRDLLRGRWGIVDVEDAVAAARYLGEQGLADPERLAIRGGSAGGYTTLAALCFHDAFAAGASHYGVADLAALAADTHKFESRYLDGLVGRWPEDRAIYEARSPIRHTEGFDRPLIVLQGSEDEVVPPNQAEMIVAALAAKGVPHAYLLFPGEQHGFRQAANIVRALEAELWFYGRVFGFDPADPIAPVDGAVGL